MPSTNGLASLFHFGAKTWRPKTAEQSYLEFEKKKHAEDVVRKQSEVQRKIELLEHIRKLEAKTQALNEMALSAEIETKEHELAMRERQVVESRQVELAKLELAKRMGQESLDEADLSRIRRERMKAELLAHASNNHAMNEFNRTAAHSEIDNPTISRMPQPPAFVPSERFMSPHPGHPPMAGPIPIHGMAPMPGHYGSIPRPDSRFMPASMSTPGHMQMPPPLGGRHSILDFHDSCPNGSHLRPRRMSDSYAIHPGDYDRGHGVFDRGPGQFDRGPGQFDRGPGDFERGGRGPSRNMFYESDRGFFDHFGPHQMYPSKNGLFNPHEPIDTQMALRAQAERLWRKKLENLDQNARRHNLNAQALRELRKRELVANLRERGAHQREIEAQAAKLVEHDHRLNEAQLRELRDKEYLLVLKAKGLQEREISEQLRRREESDREILRKELQSLERELRRKEILEAEWAIRQALEKGEAPPMGVTRPTIEDIRREGLLDDFMDGFHELNPRLQHEIISMSAHHRPRSHMTSMNEINQARSPRMPGSSRASGRAADYETASRSSSRHRGVDQTRNSPSHRPSLHSLATEDSELDFHYDQNHSNENVGRASRNETSLHDATLAARLQSAALNSEINGGKRSRASSRASQVPDDYFNPSRQRPGGDSHAINLQGESRWRSSTNADLLRSHSNSSSSEFAEGQGSRRGGFDTRAQSRSNNENYSHFGIGRSPLGSNDNSRSQSRANEPRNLYNNSHGPTQEDLSRLSTEEIELLVAGYELEPSIYQKVINKKNLSPEEIERMSAEEFDAMFSQHHEGSLSSEMSNLNVGSTSSQSQRMGGPSRHTSVSGTHSSSSPHRQSSLGRVPSNSSRSLSRGGTSSSYHSVSNRHSSRTTSRPTSAVDRPNDRPPSASRSVHRSSGQYSAAGDHRDGHSYGYGDPSNSIYTSPSQDLVENDVTVTEMSEQPGATIVKRLGKIQANSRRNLNHSQPIDTEQAGLSERNEMHQAVKNLIAEAIRGGANGIVSLRIHDVEDGSYDASGEAVVLM